MADATATAQLKITADASQAIRETDKLSKAQTGLRQSVDATAGGFGRMLDGAAIGLAKFNLALGGVQKAFGLFNAAIEMAASDARLKSMEKLLPTGAVDRFREATDGMIKRQEIARLSVKGLTGDFAMTGAQMEKVLKTSVALQEKGFGPAAEVADKLIEALGQKSVDKLDDFGIALEKTGNKAADNARAYAEFDKILANSHVSEESKNVAKLSSAMDDFSRAVQAMVAVALQSFMELGNALGRVAAYVAGARPNADLDFSDKFTAGDNEAHWAKKRIANDNANYNGRTVSFSGGRDPRAKKVKPPRPPGGGAGGYSSGAYDAGEREIGGGPGIDESMSRLGRGGLAGQFDKGGSAFGLGSQGSSFMGSSDLASIADPLKDLKNQLGDTSTAVGAAFSTISSGVLAAVDAAISGSESIGRAAMKASAAVLKSLAVESAGRALYEGALAIGSLAVGDMKGASLHGLAAGKYALAAAGMGLGAAALSSGSGGGGSNGAAGGGYARPGGASGGGSGGGGHTVNVNIGGGFADPKAIGAEVSKALRKADLAGASRSNYATRASG